ncbi:MAG: hypothetical protein L3J94_09395 [Gammaproteobacteria bacterium]|nr:hypothetical protein [Gammaproteobacteria bacterium]
MKWFCFLLLSLLLMPAYAATYQCTLPEGEVVSSAQPCAEKVVRVDEKVYPNNISSRAQAVARAEAIRAKRAAALAKPQGNGL